MIDDEQMRIYDFNRLVKDLNGLSINEYLLKVGEVYNIEKNVNDKPTKKMKFTCIWMATGSA